MKKGIPGRVNSTCKKPVGHGVSWCIMESGLTCPEYVYTGLARHEVR